MMTDRDLAPAAGRRPPNPSVTPSLPARWSAPVLPACVVPAALDAAVFYPPTVTRDDAPALAAAARAYADGLRPADEAERAELLTRLALRYPPPARVSDAEAAARMHLLIDDLAHLPADLLAAACRSAALGCRHLPTAAEIMAFAREALGDRQRRAYRLDRLAREAAASAPAAPPSTPEQRAAMAAKLGKLARRLARPTHH